MARCMRRAFKRQKRSSLLQLLFGRAARLCVRFRWMTRTSESAMEWAPALAESRRADKVVSAERKRVAFDSNSLSQYRRFFPSCTGPLKVASPSSFRGSRWTTQFKGRIYENIFLTNAIMLNRRGDLLKYYKGCAVEASNLRLWLPEMKRWFL